MERICANCKHIKHETIQGFSEYKCNVRYTVDYITGEKSYKFCRQYNYMGDCVLYEELKPNFIKRIACIIIEKGKK